MEDLNNSLFTCSVSAQGPRPTMEDTMIVKSIGKGRAFVGVFDGHGGDRVAKYCAENAPKLMSDILRLNPDIPSAIRTLYRKLDEDCKEFGETCGCCAAIAIVTRDRVWFSNCGDCMIVYEDKDGIHWGSQDHKVDKETHRLQSLGGLITHWDGCARIFGTLNIARSIGDWNLKTYVISDPFVTSVNIKESGLVSFSLASDGLWDVMTKDDYVSNLKTWYGMSPSYEKALTNVVAQAYRYGSTDNVTCIYCSIQSTNQ
jgi:serine/threonine protein phosphatase PrpC